MSADNLARLQRESMAAGRYKDILTRLPAALDAFVTGVLDEGWTLSGDTLMQRSRDGIEVARIYTRHDTHKGRIEFHATVPFELNSFRPSRFGAESPLSITVSAARTVDRIAAEIVRRLLPTARELVRVTRENEARAKAASTTVALLATRLQVAAPIFKPYGQSTPGAPDVRLHAYPAETGEKWYGDATVSSYEGGTVSFDIRNVPAELAVKIAQLLDGDLEAKIAQLRDGEVV